MGQTARIRPKVIRPLPEHLAELAGIAATGTLEVRGEDVLRRIRVIDGRVVCAWSDDVDEQLGSWLVQRKRVPESEQILVLQSQSGGDQRLLTELLVRHGLIEQGALEEELRELALTAVGRAAAVKQPNLVFLPGAEDMGLNALADMEDAQIILVAAREVGDVEAMLETIGPWDLAHCQVPNAVEASAGLSLAPVEAFTLSRLNEAQTLNSLAAMSHVSRDELTIVLYALKLIGLIELVIAVPAPVYEGTRATFAEDDDEEEPGPTVDEAELERWQREERHKIRSLAALGSQLDHYATMELRSDAPPEAIAEAWRMIRELYSPERVSEPHLPDCEEALTEISKRAMSAFEVLYDPLTRRRYDELRASLEPAPPLPDTPGGVLDVGGGGDVVPDHEETVPGGGFGVDGVAGPLSEDNQTRLAEADQLVRKGELNTAIRLLEKVCAVEPRPEVLLKLARLLLQEPRWTNRALTTLRTSLECDPGFVPAWVELAEFWAGHGRDDRARQAVDRALAVDPDHPYALEISSGIDAREH